MKLRIPPRVLHFNRPVSALVRIGPVLAVLAAFCPCAKGEPPQLWPESCLAKVLRTAKPPATASAIEVSGASDEIVSGQAVFRTASDVASATFSVSDLTRTGGGERIPASAVKLQWARYIDITRNSKGVPMDELVAPAPVSLPDPYWEDASIAVPADQAQPIWLEFHIPASTPPGDYTGELRVTGTAEPAGLPIRLHVWDFAVPQERHLSVVNWWRFPGPGFDKRVKPGTEEYWQLLARFCEFLVEHRQTDISLRFEDAEGNVLVEHDYTDDIERYAEIAFKAGIRQIDLYCVGKRTAEILDPTSRIVPNEANFRQLAAIEKIAQRRGWKNRFAVSIIDEPFVHHEESFAPLVDRVHETAPSMRCTEAIEAEYMGKLDIYIPKLNHLDLWYPRYDEARRQGAEIWFYICNHPMGRYPNRWIDQPLLKVRVLHWLNYLYDLKGFLHWALNQVREDDYYTEKAIGGKFSPGERAIVYPGREGLLGSLRFSTQRDGLQDYEYLWVLEDRLRQIKNQVGEQDAFWLDPRQRPLELCRRVIWSFHEYTRDPELMLDTRRVVAEEIEALQTAPLLVVQTSPPEGTVVPAGPRHVTVRGLVPPGAKVTVNGKPAADMRPSGYFTFVQFLNDDEPTITVQVQHDGKTRSATRTFKLTD